MDKWRAPLVAYGLAADWAGEMMAARHRGADGHQIPAIPKAWHELTADGRREVMAALSAQTRSALWEMRAREGLGPGDSISIDTRFYSEDLCAMAREALRTLLNPLADESAAWEMPECRHCAALAAVTVIAVHVQVLLMSGLADPAGMLRLLADGPEARVPAQREGQ